jgi:DNA-binding CsgD family transcriptional regulator
LTTREREILRLVVAGKSNPEIGAQLFIRHRAVATHLRNIYDKLGLRAARALSPPRSALSLTAFPLPVARRA